jgi:hypothetical protein
MDLPAGMVGRRLHRSPCRRRREDAGRADSSDDEAKGAHSDAVSEPTPTGTAPKTGD